MPEFHFLGRGLKKMFGSRNDRVLKQLSPIVGATNALEPEFEARKRLHRARSGE